MKRRAFLALSLLVLGAAWPVATGLAGEGPAAEAGKTPAAGAPADAGKEAPAAPRDGDHTASAEGYEGPVTVTLTVKDGRIAGVKVAKHEESAPGKALTEIPKRIVARQSTEVDAVTGATVTSKAIMQAAAAALASARARPEAPAGSEAAPKDPPAAPPAQEGGK